MKFSGQRAPFLCGILALGLGTLATPSSLLANLSTGLIGWYPLDGNVEDASGNNHHGTVVHGASPVTDRHGQTGKSYQVLDSHISITNPLLPQGSSSRTLSVWAKSNSSGSNSQVISQWGSNTTNQAFGLFLDEKSFWGGPYGSNLGSDVTNDQEWHHLALTLVSGNLSIYVDGIERNASSITAQTTGTTLILGKEVGSFGKAFIGAVDDLRIYNRALTPSEVAQLYLLEAPVEQNATLSGTINYTGPVTGPVVIWAKLGALTINTLTLPNGPGAYTMELPKNRRYDIKAFRDGNGNGNLDPGWEVGEPYAHHGDWNASTSSHNLLLLDGNKTGIDVNISWHGDHDDDGFLDWDEYVAGSEGNDSTSVPGIGYGLIAHWTFDETNGTVLGDSSGNDVNGTLNGFGSNSNAHWVPGKVGGALQFDGTDDYVSFPGATLLNDLAPMTFAGWVFRETDPDGGYIIAKRSTTTGYWRLNSGNTDLTWVRDYTGEHPNYTSTSPTVLDQWTHVAFTWNGEANGVNTQLYLDGVQTTNPTRFNGSGSPISDEGNLFTIGNRPQNNSSYFKGKLDDFRIWNRALSAADVHTLFHAPGFPLNDANFTKAIDLWFSDQATATATYGHIRDWNVSGVTDMSNAFKDKTTFDENITAWDVSNVTTMKRMFDGAITFNQPIGDWNVASVTNMHFMFAGYLNEGSAFNQPIGDWNVSSVTNINNMFQRAKSFNHPIGDWNISKVGTLIGVFLDASAFNQPLSDWNTSGVTHFGYLFAHASSFDQDLSDWNVSIATDMSGMFHNANSLSQTNSGKIQQSFSTNSNWPYDWSFYADANATLSGTVSYSGPVTGPVVVWAFENGQKVAEITLTNGPGPYSLQLLKNRNYDVKAFRDGNENGTLDAGWQVGEPYAHHGDWNNSSSSFNTLLLDGNKTGIDVNISWHGDHDNDGFLDWDEYEAGSEGNDSTSTPGLNYGLVAWYPFDGNASDMSGNGNHGTVHGATLGTDRYGNPGRAFSFDGNDWIDLGNVLSRYDLLSFSAWFLANSNGSWQGIVSKPRSSAGSGTALKWGGAFFIGGSSNFIINADMGSIGSWVHGTLVNDGSKVSIYVNGMFDTHRILTINNPVTSSESMLIGKELHANPPTSPGGQRYFNGSIDDVRIYDRALSSAEVEKLYHLERPGSPLTDANFTTAVNLWFSDEANATKTYGHISNWNVSGVTNMSEAFKDKTAFNEDISAWDVSKVTTLEGMFCGASSFNQPIGDWNVSAVTNMKQTFSGATNFNQPVGNWDVSSVTNMWRLFHNAPSFDQDIGDWNVSSLTISAGIFSGATSFDQDVGDWDLSKVTNMNAMFSAASSFNQDIRNWDVSSVSTMDYMFRDATAFDQDLSNWNVSTDANMSDVFFNTPALSDTNKGLIHASFSTIENWPYDWSAYIADLPPDNNQTGDNNQTAPPPDDNSTSPPPVYDHNQTHPVVDDNATAPPVITQTYRPIVRTESIIQSDDGQPLFAGTVLTDGGSPILESGFIVSQNVNFQPYVHLIAQPGESPEAFTANLQDGQLGPGKLYYFRAYSANAMGGTFGSLKKFRVPEQSAAWWARMPAVGAGWRDSEWFGTFRRHANTEWIYHAQLGWVYALSDQEDGLWLWSKEDGWLWTKPGVLPHLWKHRSGNWLYLMGSTGGKPVFYDYATGSVR